MNAWTAATLVALGPTIEWPFERERASAITVIVVDREDWEDEIEDEDYDDAEYDDDDE